MSLRTGSSDGYHWRFSSVLSNASWSPGSMGPSENDLELLSDNKTIMAVIRPDVSRNVLFCSNR